MPSRLFDSTVSAPFVLRCYSVVFRSVPPSLRGLYVRDHLAMPPLLCVCCSLYRWMYGLLSPIFFWRSHIILGLKPRRWNPVVNKSRQSLVLLRVSQFAVVPYVLSSAAPAVFALRLSLFPCTPPAVSLRFSARVVIFLQALTSFLLFTKHILISTAVDQRHKY